MWSSQKVYETPAMPTVSLSHQCLTVCAWFSIVCYWHGRPSHMIHLPMSVIPMTWLNLMQSIHVIDIMVVKDDGESVHTQIIISDFYLVRFDGEKYVWFCGTSSWLWCHTWSPTNEISEIPSLDDKEKYTKQVQHRKIDVWCLYWVKLTSRILRKLPHPNIEKKRNRAFHVPYGCRVGTTEQGLSKQACRVTCHCHVEH